MNLEGIHAQPLSADVTDPQGQRSHERITVPEVAFDVLSSTSMLWQAFSGTFPSS